MSALNSPRAGSVIISRSGDRLYRDQSMAKWARRNDMILHLRGGALDLYQAAQPRRLVPRHREVDAARRRRSYPCGTVVGKLEGDPRPRAAIHDICREDTNPARLEHGVFFDQHWASSTS
jgi:ribulose-bisphosphate carboxylase large chain